MQPDAIRDRIRAFSANPPSKASEVLMEGAKGRKGKSGTFDTRQPALRGWRLAKSREHQRLDGYDYFDSWNLIWLTEQYELLFVAVTRATEFFDMPPTETWGVSSRTALDADLERIEDEQPGCVERGLDDLSRRAPANWYPDPDGISAHRYWDGQNWTAHRA